MQVAQAGDENQIAQALGTARPRPGDRCTGSLPRRRMTDRATFETRCSRHWRGHRPGDRPSAPGQDASARSRRCAASTSRSRRARCSASSAPTAPARRRRSTCSARSPSRPAARRDVAGHDVVARARRRAPQHRPRVPGPDARRLPDRGAEPASCTPSSTACSRDAGRAADASRCWRWSGCGSARTRPSRRSPAACAGGWRSRAA